MSDSFSLGVSWAGRGEVLSQPVDCRFWGLSSLRLPVYLPLKTEDLASLATAHQNGYFILAVLKFLPQDKNWPEMLLAALPPLSFITHWEIESEPDDPTFGWPADHLTTYAACLIKAAALIKGINPHARIHNGGLGRSLPKGITQLCALKAADSIDIWNVHPYTNPLMPDARGCLRYFQGIIRQTLVKEGQAHKPLWWSSIACPGMSDPKITPDWWLGKNPTEALQAEWFKTVRSIAANSHVERMFWEGWQDSPHQTDTGIDYFGLLRADGSPKPALESLRQPTGLGL